MIIIWRFICTTPIQFKYIPYNRPDSTRPTLGVTTRIRLPSQLCSTLEHRQSFNCSCIWECVFNKPFTVVDCKQINTLHKALIFSVQLLCLPATGSLCHSRRREGGKFHCWQWSWSPRREMLLPMRFAFEAEICSSVVSGRLIIVILPPNWQMAVKSAAWWSVSRQKTNLRLNPDDKTIRLKVIRMMRLADPIIYGSWSPWNGHCVAAGWSLQFAY